MCLTLTERYLYRILCKWLVKVIHKLQNLRDSILKRISFLRMTDGINNESSNGTQCLYSTSYQYRTCSLIAQKKKNDWVTRVWVLSAVLCQQSLLTRHHAVTLSIDVYQLPVARHVRHRRTEISWQTFIKMHIIKRRYLYSWISSIYFMFNGPCIA